MIDHSTIEKILDTAEIVDVVQDFVSIKKRGVNYLGLCPFHNEKTPSFSVSPSKGIFKCFGCGKGGNAVNFIMEHEHLSYIEALKYLARKYHIEIVEKELTSEDKQKQTERDSLFIVTSFAQKYFTDILYNHKEGVSVALSYFNHRGFRDETIKKFQLGYCLESKDAFTQTAIRKGYKLELLVKAGLTIQQNVNTFDRFRERVIFPIHSLSGNIIAFGARTLLSDKNISKYINSPESEIYHKSNALYGIFFAKKAIVEQNKCYLTEGYTDVISLHQSGIENVVASSGTSLTPEQIRLIKRFTTNITILYDGDPAGIKAALRGIDMILEEGMNVKVLLFPDGEDPDSFSKKVNSTELHSFLTQNEHDFIVFKTQLLLKEAAKDPVKKAMLITDVVQSIAVIPDIITRSVYIKECSTLMNVEEQILYTEVSKKRRQKAEQEYRREQAVIQRTKATISVQPTVTDYTNTLIEQREIIRYLINYGSYELFVIKKDIYEPAKAVSVAQYIFNELKQDNLSLTHPVIKQIFEEYENSLNNGIILESKHFTKHPDKEINSMAADLVTTKYKLSKIHSKAGVFVETEDMKLRELVPKAIYEYKSKLIFNKLKDIELMMKQAQQNKNYEEFEEYLQQFVAITQVKLLLSKNLGDRTILI
ncbi:MAG: DNA primase [Bacteroidia bacterium]|nr:DNA primase [Bacteroidia bacterium]